MIRAVTACSLDEGAQGGCGDAVVEAEGCGGWVNYGSARKESPSLFLHTEKTNRLSIIWLMG